MTDDDLRKLSELAKPFPPEQVSWRVGSTNADKTKGMALAYIDSRDVQDRLDGVMGADWADEIAVQPNGLVCCKIGLRLSEGWVWRMDGTAALPPQAAGEENAKAEQAREMAHKGSVSDAFKRAAVKWGIGRYLYALPSPWVSINKWKAIEDSERPKLVDTLRRQAGPSQSAPRQQQPAPAQPAAQQQNASQARKSGEYERIEKDLRACQQVGDLAETWLRAQEAIGKMPDSWKVHITAEKDRCKERLLKPQLEAAE